MERFLIIVNGFHALSIITKRSLLDVAAVLDPPLHHLNCSFILACLKGILCHNKIECFVFEKIFTRKKNQN